jgi:colanic acid/amylovoran biosynthesis glycosyltransferase
VKIAYLINQYPKVSHSFIRREIAALEAHGAEILRFAIRSCAEELVDQADKAELQKTRIVLEEGYLILLSSFLRTLVTRPLPFLDAIKLAIKIGWNSDRGLLIHFAYLAEACVLLRWFLDLDIPHAHSHFGTNATSVLMLCQVLGGPTYSFTVHGPEEFDKPLALALSEKIQRARSVIAISSFTRSQLFRWCNYTDWRKIHLVRCGLDESNLNHHLTSVPAVSQIVCVGRLCEQKGQLLLIKAAKRLAEKGINFRLVLVGDGPLRSEIETLIHDYRLGHLVKITGWASSESVRQHILESRFLVLPSFAEGLPVVLMEALALGRAVVTTTIAGIPELIESNQCGWLIPPGSIEDLEKSLCTALATENDTLEDMGKLGQAKVATLHNAATEAQKLLHLFKENQEELDDDCE